MPNIDQVQLPDGSQYNLKDNVSNYVTAGYVDDAIDALTKADVGLGKVDNTSDLNKPVSTAQQTALNGKTDTTVIAPTETTTTASRRYEIGEQFILNGVLYTATAVIASGDTIIVNTNCDLSENITEQIEEKAEKTDLTSISESGTTASQAISAGTIFYLNGALVKAKVDIASGATFTVGTNIEVTNVNNALNGIIKVGNISKSVSTTASAQAAVSITVPQIDGYKAVGIVSYNIPITSGIVQPAIVAINDAGTSVTIRFVTNLSTTINVTCKVMYVKNGFYS